jgi:hypothetical protein
VDIDALQADTQALRAALERMTPVLDEKGVEHEERIAEGRRHLERLLAGLTRSLRVQVGRLPYVKETADAARGEDVERLRSECDAEKAALLRRTEATTREVIEVARQALEFVKKRRARKLGEAEARRTEFAGRLDRALPRHSSRYCDRSSAIRGC